MGASDDELDATSRRLLNQIEELKRLELEKRRTARDSDEFRDLAEKVERAARDVFDATVLQRSEGDEDSPIEAEQDEQHPGDWTEGSRI
jgi:hypothetical protein